MQPLPPLSPPSSFVCKQLTWQKKVNLLWTSNLARPVKLPHCPVAGARGRQANLGFRSTATFPHPSPGADPLRLIQGSYLDCISIIPNVCRFGLRFCPCGTVRDKSENLQHTQVGGRFLVHRSPAVCEGGSSAPEPPHQTLQGCPYCLQGPPLKPVLSAPFPRLPFTQRWRLLPVACWETNQARLCRLPRRCRLCLASPPLQGVCDLEFRPARRSITCPRAPNLCVGSPSEHLLQSDMKGGNYLCPPGLQEEAIGEGF